MSVESYTESHTSRPAEVVVMGRRNIQLTVYCELLRTVIFIKNPIGMGAPAVISIQDVQQGGQDTSLGCTSGHYLHTRHGVIHTNPLGSSHQKFKHPQGQVNLNFKLRNNFFLNTGEDADY